VSWNGHFQRHRNPLDINERHVSLSALDSTDVGTIQTANVGKLFLRHTEPISLFADVPLDQLGSVELTVRQIASREHDIAIIHVADDPSTLVAP
jgi:hypothetical protein